MIRNADIRRELGHGLSDAAFALPERFIIVRTGIYAPLPERASDWSGAARFWWTDPNDTFRDAPDQS